MHAIILPNLCIYQVYMGAPSFCCSFCKLLLAYQEAILTKMSVCILNPEVCNL